MAPWVPNSAKRNWRRFVTFRENIENASFLQLKLAALKVSKTVVFGHFVNQAPYFLILQYRDYCFVFANLHKTAIFLIITYETSYCSVKSHSVLIIACRDEKKVFLSLIR